MTVSRVDQFESAFKAAAKTRYAYNEVSVDKILVVTDLDEYETHMFSEALQQFLVVLGTQVEWRTIRGDEFKNVEDLLDILERERPNLVCTYRNLHDGQRKWPYSLGVFLDVLTQVTSTPVLLMPDIEGKLDLEQANTDSVMVVTDVLTGDDRLVDYGVKFTAEGGQLTLAHVEDGMVFQRYLNVISKIPSLDTDVARTEIERQLLKEPRDFVESCRQAIEALNLSLEVLSEVTMGHRLADYKRLVQERKVDLLVFNTKDHEQLAMHGVAYPLVVELRRVPMLLL